MLEYFNQKLLELLRSSNPWDSKVRNMWHSFEMEHSTNPAPRYRRRRHHVHAPPRSKIPKSDRFVLRPAHEHRASPIVQGEHVSAVTAQRLEGGACGAIGDVDLAITGTAADQQTRLVRGIFQKAQIANRAVVHRKLHFLTWKERNRKKNKGFYFFFFSSKSYVTQELYRRDDKSKVNERPFREQVDTMKYTDRC